MSRQNVVAGVADSRIRIRGVPLTPICRARAAFASAFMQSVRDHRLIVRELLSTDIDKLWNSLLNVLSAIQFNFNVIKCQKRNT